MVDVARYSVTIDSCEGKRKKIYVTTSLFISRFIDPFKIEKYLANSIERIFGK